MAANNQVIAADADDVQNRVTTDPVPLLGRDRASAILAFHFMVGGGETDLVFSYETEVSNDGQNWVQRGPNYTTNSMVVPVIQETQPVHGKFIRFVMWYKIAASGTVGSVGFDLHVRLDHE